MVAGNLIVPCGSVKITSPSVRDTLNLFTPTDNAEAGVEVPIPTLPKAVTLKRSRFLVRITKSIESVVPIKLVRATVPEFPANVQKNGVFQLAKPLASEVKILFNPCVPSRILTLPCTCNLAVGSVVPIPNLPKVSSRIRSKLLLINLTF